MSQEPEVNFTIDQLIASVEREIGLRYRVYPNLINRGKMTAEESKREIALMGAVLSNLKAQLPPPAQAKFNLD